MRIEAKGKQGTQWPNCKVISDHRSILVLVDFANKSELERPDFYILNFDDWNSFLKNVIKKFPDKGIETFEERPILLKFKKGENFNNRNTLKYFED